MARPFPDVLRDLGGGTACDELTAALAEVVEAVMMTRKVGEVSIKLKIKPNGETGVMISDDIKTKVPQAPRGDTLFFATSGGSLLREDPRQEKLPLRQVEGTNPREGTNG